MPPQTKANLLTRIINLLKKRYAAPKPEPRPALDQILLALLEEDATPEAAQAALARLQEQYHGWNEIRVSSVSEIQETLGSLPAGPEKAERLRLALRSIFINYYSFDLEAIKKSNQKQAAAQIEKLQGIDDYVRASMVRDVLGGHAIPVDQPLLRALRRLGLINEEGTSESVRSGLERLVPKARGMEFSRLITALAADTCVEGIPDCPRCILVEICPTGKQRMHEGKAAESRAAAKRASQKH